jgi:transposase
MAKRTRPYKGLERRYIWRLYPTSEQQTVLLNQMSMCADLWNALLSMCEQRYQRAVQRKGKSITFHCYRCAALSDETGKLTLCEDHRHPSEFTMGSWVTEMLKECPEWREGSTWTPRRVAGSLDMAWKAFFKGGGYPRYKSRYRSFKLPHRCCSGCKFNKSNRHQNSWHIYMKGIGNVWGRRESPTEIHEWMDADVLYHAGRWTISVAVDAASCEHKAIDIKTPITIKFGILEGFAEVNGIVETPLELTEAQILDDQRADLQAEFDLRYPRGKRLSDQELKERFDDRLEISRLSARIARKRRHALHKWARSLVNRASIITVMKPTVKDDTASPRGDEKNWGASVEAVSGINRTMLSYAPAMAASILEYKAEELGVWGGELEITSPMGRLGATLKTAGKVVRKVRRKIKEVA